MHPGLMMMPGTGGGAQSPASTPGAGAGAGAGAAVGADVLSDAVNDNNEGVTDNPYDVPIDNNGSGGDGFGGEGESQSEPEWATFEEADHGFTEEPNDESWGSEFSESGGDGEGSRGLFDVINDIFGGDN